MYYVYILTSQKDPEKIYIGLTTDLNNRLEEHNSFQSSYSKRCAPWQLNTYMAFTSKPAAVKFETYLKSGSGFAFLKKRLLG